MIRNERAVDAIEDYFTAVDSKMFTSHKKIVEAGRRGNTGIGEGIVR